MNSSASVHPSTVSKVNWLRIIIFFISVVLMSLPFNLNLFHFDWSKYTYLAENLTYVPAAIGTLLAFVFFSPFLISQKKLVGVFGQSLPYSLLFWLCPVLFFTIAGVPKANSHAQPMLFAFVYSGINALYALCEELSWRGYLQNELRPLGDWPRFLLTGALWWFWHLRFNSSFDFYIFPPLVMLSAIGLGKLAEDTRSCMVSAGAHLLVILLTNTGGIGVNTGIAAGLTIITWIFIYKKLRYSK